MSLETFLADYGLIALFMGAALEGETTVVVGGMAVHRGTLDYGAAVAVATAGSFVADQGFFAIGRYFRDRAWVQRMIARPAFARALAAFERRPTLFVFGFRFLYGLRIVSPIAIGTSKLRQSRFVLLNLMAALLWATTFISAGYWFGEALETLFGHIRQSARWIAVALAVAIVAGALIARVRQRLRR